MLISHKLMESLTSSTVSGSVGAEIDSCIPYTAIASIGCRGFLGPVSTVVGGTIGSGIGIALGVFLALTDDE